MLSSKLNSKCQFFLTQEKRMQKTNYYNNGSLFEALKIQGPQEKSRTYYI